MHIAVILPRWVGDTIMATPVLRALRAHYGSTARITGVMRPLFRDLLAGTDWLDGMIPYDRHKRDPAVGFRAAARALAADRPDVALVLPGSLSSAALAFAGRARRRVGHAGNLRRLLLTDPLPLPVRDGRVEVLPPPVAYMEVAAAIGVAGRSLRVSLATTPADEALAESVLAELFPGRPGPLVVLNDGGAFGGSKSWGVAKHAALARWLVARLPDCRVLVHCGPGDREPARAIVAEAGLPVVRGLGDLPDLPLGLSKAIYRRAALSITSCSGPRHIGAAFGVPTVAILGPVDPRLGRSDPAGCVEVRLDLVCSPCGQPACPLGHHDCMRLVGVEQVGRAALDLLARGDRATLPGRAG